MKLSFQLNHLSFHSNTKKYISISQIQSLLELVIRKYNLAGIIEDIE